MGGYPGLARVCCRALGAYQAAHYRAQPAALLGWDARSSRGVCWGFMSALHPQLSEGSAYGALCWGC